MSRIYEFLKTAGVFFIATEEGEQARVRPFGLVFEFDDKLYFGVGDFKPSYAQLRANPKFEISAVKNNNSEWLRLSAEAVFDNRPEAVEQAFRVLPYLRDSYPENGEHKLAVFYADIIEAYAYDLSGKKEKL